MRVSVCQTEIQRYVMFVALLNSTSLVPMQVNSVALTRMRLITFVFWFRFRFPCFDVCSSWVVHHELLLWSHFLSYVRYHCSTLRLKS